MDTGKHVTDKPRQTSQLTAEAFDMRNWSTGTGWTERPVPGSLFNAMILPWANYTIRGAIWFLLPATPLCFLHS